MLPETTEPSKKCSVCKIVKTLSHFYPRRTRNQQYQSECRECCRIRRSKWWKSDIGKYSSANTKLKLRFGITTIEYQELLEKQDFRCLICGATSSCQGHKLAVDYDHKTGKIRGLLCKGCNVGLGNFKDSEILLNNAIVYLRARR